jgi:hypothetical protein
VHGDEDIASSDKLLVDVQLGDRRPVRVLLDTRAQLRVLEYVESSETLGIHALETEDLDDGAGESAGRCFRCALHEENDGGGGDGLVDSGSRLIGEQTDLEGGEEGFRGEGGDRCSGDVGSGGAGPEGLPAEALDEAPGQPLYEIDISCLKAMSLTVVIARANMMPLGSLAAVLRVSMWMVETDAGCVRQGLGDKFPSVVMQSVSGGMTNLPSPITAPSFVNSQPTALTQHDIVPARVLEMHQISPMNSLKISLPWMGGGLIA